MHEVHFEFNGKYFSTVCPRRLDRLAVTQEETLLDDIIDRLLGARDGRPGKQVQLTEQEIRQLCVTAKEVFMSQPNLLELEAPIKICGQYFLPPSSVLHNTHKVGASHVARSCDIHGQYSDLLRLFEYGGFPPEANYLFLGDYVDRGKQSLETIALLLAYKDSYDCRDGAEDSRLIEILLVQIKYPENFFLLRGNHECASINRIYGFYDECKRRYNIRLWKTFTDCFNCLPVTALVDEKILCMHGGLSPELKNLEQIKKIPRPTDHVDPLLAASIDVISQFTPEAHQHKLRQLVTIFSAPNYCGEFDNAGAMMSVDETLMCSFQ
eukprot:scaffold3809_cov47-Prasinocladus_malaysianus.AAC.1